MDPITQGVVGALAAQVIASKKNLRLSAAAGAMAGMAADLDVFIQSEADPLLALEYHRHFTHALVFIPFGATLSALFFYFTLGRWLGRKYAVCFLWCLMGYATHGLLDACTSYGTLLYWPFTNSRISWDVISVIDPLLTLPLLLAVVLAALARWRLAVIGAVVWCATYLALGWLQHERAIATGYDIAAARGQQTLRLQAKPSFANLVVWKVIYETDTSFHVDAVRLGWSQVHVWNGESIAKLDLERDFPWLAPDSQQADDVRRFRWFSNDFVARDSEHANRVIDVRYSLVPNEIEPLWWIELEPRAPADAHVEYEQDRGDARQAAAELWHMVLGREPDAR